MVHGARYTVHCTLQWSLWATMARCLPLLAPPIEEHAPTVIALCRRLEQSNAGLAALARRDAERYGELLRSTHCGGGMWAVILCAQAATLCIPVAAAVTCPGHDGFIGLQPGGYIGLQPCVPGP